MRLRSVAGLWRWAAGKSGSMFLFHWRVFHHCLTAARTEDQAFEKRIAGQAIGAVHAGAGSLSRGVEAGQGSAAPKIGFDTAHHVMRGGADGSDVPREIDSVAHASGVDAGETLFDEAFGLGGH